MRIRTAQPKTNDQQELAHSSLPLSLDLQEFLEPGKLTEFLALKKLPYLAGFIKEGLRLGYGFIGRLPRVVPEPGPGLNGRYLLAGTVVRMSSWIMHRQPSIFPDPERSDTERWTDPAKGAGSVGIWSVLAGTVGDVSFGVL
ncbi:cytochrome P450 [Aspergillus terricola var. indicus]